MTSSYKLSDFQTQLTNVLNNIYRPDETSATLVKQFTSLTSPTIDDFNALVSSLQTADYTSTRGQVTSSPITTLLVAQQSYLTLQNANLLGTNDITTSGTMVMKCVPAKSGPFSLQPITEIFTNLIGLHEAQTECMTYSKTSGDHYLTITGEVSGCKGPYHNADAYYHCISGL